MKKLSKDILKIVETHNGIKASEIAKLLGCDKKSVNSALYSVKELKNYCWQDDSYKWYSNDVQSNVDDDNQEERMADEKLHNICKYYLSCLSAEANSGVSSFLTSKYGDLPYVEIGGVEKEDFQNELVVDFLNKNVKKDSISSYLGYPILLDKFKSKEGNYYYKIFPVFLWPVEYNVGNIEISDFPSININVIKKYADNNSQETIYDQIQLEEELGINKEDVEIPIDEMVLKLKNLRAWNWKEELDPDSIDMSKSLSTYTEPGIYNKAVIISCEKSPYTIGLEGELASLSKKTTEDIKGTALYDWIYGYADEIIEQNLGDAVLEVLPLNSEQYQAVESALNQKTTIVTGPPGTGKSQVVTDILVNMAYNNRSVLFSSKNNKAVDVVNTRVNGLARRPVMIRVSGDSSSSASYLAELVENLLTAYNDINEVDDYEFYKEKYNEALTKRIELNNKKKEIYSKRNKLDKFEQKIRTLSEAIQKQYSLVSDIKISELRKMYSKYLLYYKNADREQQPYFTKLFWKWKSKERKEVLEKQTEIINEELKEYNFQLTNTVDYSSFKSQDTKIKQLMESLEEVNSYKKMQEEMKHLERLEEIDYKIADVDNLLSDIAVDLWKEWLQRQNSQITSQDRKEMSDYIAAVKLLGNVDADEDEAFKKQFKSLHSKMTKYLPCWAVTSLSAKGRIPFRAAVYDLLIIDEASQCDIASILPLLYRTKRTVIIGDPKQLKHISSISNKQDYSFIKRYKIEPSWLYSEQSLYGLANGLVSPLQIIRLRDHHRSCSDIIEFSNQEFYDGKLRIATDYSKLKPPKNYNIGIRWIDIQGECIKPNNGSLYNIEEVSRVVEELKRLVDNDYEGTIGVVTPFRAQADRIREMVEKNRELDIVLKDKHNAIIDTVHKFQGDEKDTILFSPVISNNASNGAIAFLNQTGNLFNVGITRARSTLIVIGDKKKCAECPVSYMNHFVEYYDKLQTQTKEKIEDYKFGVTRDYPIVSNENQVSEWEKYFYSKLFEAGVRTIPQYPVDKYFLDLAIIDGDRKLDIEVDGARYHRDWNGELCYRDQIRNKRLKELGWDVLRFWVYQIRDELPWCIEEIKKWLGKKNEDFRKDESTKVEKNAESEYLCEKCGEKMLVKEDKYGKYLICPNYPKCENMRSIQK